jgi:citrate lyase synthetase
VEVARLAERIDALTVGLVTQTKSAVPAQSKLPSAQAGASHLPAVALHSAVVGQVSIGAQPVRSALHC